MARLLAGLAALTCAIAAAGVPVTELHPLSDAFINLINSEQNTWIAGRNFPEDTPIEYLRSLNGVRKNQTLFDQLPVMEHTIERRSSLPDNFDPREKWPNCPSLNEIRDQGACGSCWAFGAVSAMTDRYCIQSNGKQFHFSAEDLLSCSNVGDCPRGGDSVAAWNYWVSNGLVSGGNYDSRQGCRPYSIKPCIHGNGGEEDGLKKCTGHGTPTPACKQQCREGYEVPYEKDLKRGKSVYAIRGEEHIMAELYESGPVEADFLVFSDFLDYKGGVYQHTYGEFLGGHAVKLLGWGVENGNKYWLLANSWNEHFGVKGFFKILRGSDECGIEEDIIAGNPLI